MNKRHKERIAESIRSYWKKIKHSGDYERICNKMSESKGGRNYKKFYCQECGIKFKGYGNRKFCSLKCAHKNNDFRKNMSKSKKDNPTKYWLSKKRPKMKNVKGFNRTGTTPWNKSKQCPQLAKENHWNWQEGKSSEKHSFYFKTLSKQLRKKANCTLCNINNDLVVHHIDLNKENNSLDNLVVLCRSCHAKLHHKIKTGIVVICQKN